MAWVDWLRAWWTTWTAPVRQTHGDASAANGRSPGRLYGLVDQRCQFMSVARARIELGLWPRPMAYSPFRRCNAARRRRRPAKGESQPRSGLAPGFSYAATVN